MFFLFPIFGTKIIYCFVLWFSFRFNKVDTCLPSATSVYQVSSSKQIHPDSTCSPKFKKNSSGDSSKEIGDEQMRYDLPDDRRPGRREWRKSPDCQDKHDKVNRVSDNNRDCDSTNEEFDVNYSSRNIDGTKDRRDPRSRQERERRFCYEDNIKRNWSNSRDRHNQSWINRNDNRSRRWSNDNDYQHSNENSWRGREHSWSNPQPTLIPVSLLKE